MEKERYLIFIPAFQASKTITKVLSQLNALPFEFDVLVVDNHSDDGTLDVVREYAQKNNFDNYYCIRNIKNIGYGGSQKVALSFGMFNGYDKLIILHADNQYPVGDIPRLVAHNKKTKAALSIGTRL
jgi:dolichol-phosphate mannosyltransferase